MPLGYTHPTVAETNTNIETTVPTGQVSVVQSSDVGLVHTSMGLEVSRVACAVGVTADASFVQQTVDVKALLACDSLVFGQVAEITSLSVVISPAESAGVAVVPPTREFVGPALRPWHTGSQTAAVVVPFELVGFRETVIDRPQTTQVSLYAHNTVYYSVKTLAELGSMLC